MGGLPAQSLVQECLNRTERLLWGVVTNGRQLRLLRDSSAIATASYVEFDLEAIFDGELFSEFVLLYRLLHVSRFAIPDGSAPSACWLEKWRLDAIVSGTRALDRLRHGVRAAITTLGTGFLRHPANSALRDDVDAGALHIALLRLVYRLLFVFVAEDRGVLHPVDADSLAKERYAAYFSTARLREHARHRRGTSHDDLYQALRIVLDALGNEKGLPELGLPGLGGIFDDCPADAVLHGQLLSNEYLLAAVRHLAQVRDVGSRRWRAVDYRRLGSEELGSIYEWLLEQVPKHSEVDREFELVDLAGNSRKTTGSYYTPTSLIDCLLDSALDPVIDDAVKRGELSATRSGAADATGSIVDELLSLTVCDPACGSGHFLVAAARRIAKQVAAARERNPEPDIEAVQHALHEVTGRCIYGVDLNPMAVELAKVSLWLEALEPGRALNFLDAHVKCGNALIGATPALLRKGVPDAAFKSIEGDDKKVAKTLERQNKEERVGQAQLFADEELHVGNSVFATGLRRITDSLPGTLSGVHRVQSTYHEFAASAEYVNALHVADAWCAAFLWRKTANAPPAITENVFRNLADAPAATHTEIERLSEQYRFFHWHLEFPEVFSVADEDGEDDGPGWRGGFDCVLSNPPWDKVDFEDKKYFSVVEPLIAGISGTARRARILEWMADHPEAAARYYTQRRKQKATFHFAAKSTSFPLCQKGLSTKGVNSLFLDHLFAERLITILQRGGRLGAIVPTSIATGAGAAPLFEDLARRRVISSLYDFENRRKTFVGLHASYKFCLLTVLADEQRETVARFGFFMQDVSDVDIPERTFTLAPAEILLISPNTGNIPIFRTRRDANLTTAIHRRFPVLCEETDRSANPWGLSFKNLFNSTDDSDLFRDAQALEDDGWKKDGWAYVRGSERMLPVYEGKLAHLFDHRWNYYYGNGDDDYDALSPDAKNDPTTTTYPRRWMRESGSIKVTRHGRALEIPAVSMRLKAEHWQYPWLCGWRDIANTTNERTAIPAFIPISATVETFPLMLPSVAPATIATLVAVQSCFVVDYVTRQKAGNAHVGRRIWKQLPVPTPEMMEPHTPFVTSRVLELVYTAYDMAGLAEDLGDAGPPFRWDEGRRAQIRAELDAYFFHLYGIERDDADYIMETFQSDSGGGLKNNEIAKFGSYRTKELILAEYDRMAAAGVSLTNPLIDGENYKSMLRPPPGHGPRHSAKDS